jgi:hypothetical protein
MELRVTHSATRSAVSALVIGDAADAHFRACTAWLDANLNSVFAGDVRHSIEAHDAFCPMLVVLLQSRPGQFVESELAVLRSRWPLARIVGIYGSWSEGEPRNGPAASGVYRIAWHAAIARLSESLERAPQSRSASRPGHLFDLPATATADERLLAHARAMSSARRTIAVAAVRASYADPLVEALAAAGNAAFYWPLDGRATARGIDAVVWDAFGCEHDLEQFRKLLPGGASETPVVATLDFPRPQDVARLAELGVMNLLGKPLLVTDVLGCLDMICASREEGELLQFAVA